MFWSILHRTIFWELTRVFLLSLLGITGILLMAGIVAEASRHGLGPGQLLAIIPLIVPRRPSSVATLPNIARNPVRRSIAEISAVRASSIRA